MNESIGRLVQRIHDELEEIARVVQRAQKAWQEAQRTGDDLYLDSVAVSLHAFYGGLETLFEAVASAIDGARPSDEDWHRALLDQMARDVSARRPAVVSASTRTRLDEFRRFRHLVRHMYPFRFDPERMRPLVSGVDQLLEDVRAELLAFAEFLLRSVGENQHGATNR